VIYVTSVNSLKPKCFLPEHTIPITGSFHLHQHNALPIPVAARSKERACGHSLAWIVGSNLAEGVDVSLVSVVCCQVEVSAAGPSLVQRSPTERGAFETSTMRRSRTSRAVKL
jgi:hypothetical protein